MPATRQRADVLTDRPIVLVGFMAAGKSRVGRTLAQQLNLPFVDTDAEIEQSCGLPIAEIFRDRGEAEFRQTERRLISRLLAARPRVIALGGGAFLDNTTRQAASRQAYTVWLDTPFEVVLARLARSTTRPLAVGRSEAELRKLWAERRPCYAQAHVRIETLNADPEQVAEQIIRELRQARQRQEFAPKNG